jgi:pimeloyl-ACP methyl ester carboxylesterase
LTRSAKRRRRWPWYLLVLALVVVLLFYGGGGVYFSDVIDERALDAAARRADAADLEPNVAVVNVRNLGSDDGSITVRGIPDAEEPANLYGPQGLRWETGYGRITGPTQTLGAARVDVSFTLVSGQPPAAGTRAELDVRAYPFDPLEGDLRLQAITVPGPLGDYPAWLAPAGGDTGGDTWAIVVHGNSLSPADGLRSVPILTDAGFPTLVASYRNDPGAPADPSGFLGYGLTEWEDLEAMVGYALEQGSDGVVLDGYSMGGGIVMAFLQRSPLASEVRAVILDAPMLDFSETVDDNAAREEIAPDVMLPPSLTAVAKRLATWRFGVDWAALDYMADTSSYEGMAFLVFHGTDDETVPIGTSRAFKRLLPDQVQLIECEGAGHIGCWNTDPDAYASAIDAFLTAVLSARSA